MDLFGGPDIPQPQLPNQPRVDDSGVQDAGRAELLRRARALGKQKTVVAGDLGGYGNYSAPTLLTKLGGL